MSFIRVTQRNGSRTKTDLNVNHVVWYTPGARSEGSDILLSNDEILPVNESPRSLRSFIKKAQGILPAPASDLAPMEAGATGE
jgi:hypothetical protein